MEHEVEAFSGELKLKEWDALVADEQEVTQLKEEIQEVRAARAKMRSVSSSVSSSITIYPTGTPTSSPDEEVPTENSLEETEGAQHSEKEHSLNGEETQNSDNSLDADSHQEQSLQEDS